MTACDVLRDFYNFDEETAKEILSELRDTTSLQRLAESRAHAARAVPVPPPDDL